MRLRTSLVVLVLLSMVAAKAPARQIEIWPYPRLMKEANLVVIATANKTTDTKARFTPKGWKAEFVGQRTEFTVRGVLKGKLSGTKFTVTHFRLPRGISVANGPMLVEFRSTSRNVRGDINGEKFAAALPKPDYLLFLRRGKDGRYVPVSGQIDPALSTRELNTPDGFLSRLGGR